MSFSYFKVYVWNTKLIENSTISIRWSRISDEESQTLSDEVDREETKNEMEDKLTQYNSFDKLCPPGGLLIHHETSS